MHVAAGHRADFGHAERVAHFGAAQISLLDGGLQQAGHGFLNLILQLVNDGVQPDIHLLHFRQLLRLAFRTHAEADDDGVRCRGQQYVGLSNGAYAGVQDFDLHFCRGQLGQRISQHFD